MASKFEQFSAFKWPQKRANVIQQALKWLFCRKIIKLIAPNFCMLKVAPVCAASPPN